MRQRCTFCCVLCTCGVYEYHHFAPPFAEAHGHDPDGITLLCGTHHDKATRGIIKPEEVRAADQRRRSAAPDALLHRLFLKRPTIHVLGSIVLLGEGPILSFDGTPLLSVAPGEHGIAEITSRFFDGEGRETVYIDKNEIKTRVRAWDVEVEGEFLTIREQPRRIALEMRLAPPRGVYIRRISMHYRNCGIDSSTGGEINVSSAGGGGLFCPPNSVTVAGSLSLNDRGMTLSGGAAIIPGYPGSRLRELAERGDFETIFEEISPLRPTNRGGENTSG